MVIEPVEAPAQRVQRVDPPLVRAKERRYPVVGVVLGILGLGASILGFQDVSTGLNLESRLVGGLYAAVGLVMLGGAAGVTVRNWSNSGGLLLAAWAGAVGAVMALPFAYAQLQYAWDFRLLLVVQWLLISLGSLAAAVLAFRAYKASADSKPPVAGRRYLPPDFWSVSSALGAIGLLLALVQFWNSSIFETKTNPWRLIMSPTIADAGPSTHPGWHLFSWEVDISNPGDKPVKILTSLYHIRGIVTKPTVNSPIVGSVVDGMRDPASFPVDRNTSVALDQTLNIGPLIQGSADIEGHFQLAAHGVVEVPDGAVRTYSYLRLYAFIAVTAPDSFDIASPTATVCRSAGTESTCVMEWALRHPSLFSRIIRGEEVIDLIAKIPTVDGEVVGDISFTGCVQPRGSSIDHGRTCQQHRDNSLSGHLGEESIFFDLPAGTAIRYQ